MNIWGIVGACSVLLLAGIWIYERLPRWRAQAARDGREPSTEDQFGERFFTPDLSQIAARLRRIAGEELGKDLSRLHPDDSLVETLFDGFDSLDSVEVLMAIEDEFGIELDDAAITDCVTFRDFVEAVAARRPFLVKWRQKMGRGTEEKLGVRLSREVLVKLATPIELADAVAAELKNQVGGQKSCQHPSGMEFLSRDVSIILEYFRKSYGIKMEVEEALERITK